MKRFIMMTILLAIIMFGIPQLCIAEQEVMQVGEIQVTAPRKKEGIVVAPSTTTINVDEYKVLGTPQNIVDILKDRAIIDFRGETDLVPDDDTIYMRGFNASRFVTAIDGLTIQKTGGRKSSHIVDYALLPTWLIEKIEIMPGPHSALYPGKSIGGILNLITKTPKKYPTLKPDVNVTTSYQSYNTQNHNINLQGGVNSFIYDVGYQKYLTDGYLRNNEADIDTVFGRIGYILPSDGHITLSASFTDADREIAVNNDPAGNDYDSDYPEVTSSAFDPIQRSTWDKEATSYRLNYKQPTPIGIWTFSAYKSKENRERNYWDRETGTEYTEWETIWWQHGGRIQDEIRFGENHVTTIGFDIAQMYDNGPGEKKKRMDNRGGYLQHEWTIIPRLNLTAGLRYEDINVWVQNYNSTTGVNYITGRENWIERNWDQFVPKSFLTYELDDISEMLRDTSLSLGVSKIWHAPDYHGVYNGQGIPSGAWLEPEHGIAYDFVFTRRLWNDVNLKMGYAFYEIKDFIASNGTYDKYDPRRDNRPNVPYGQEYKDYKLNLEKVHRHGVEVELGGHLLENLSFYLAYAYQEFENQGSERAGETNLDQRAKHRVNAGLRFDLFENTLLMLDYSYQSKEVTETVHDGEENPDEWYTTEVQIDPYHMVDFGIEQTLFKDSSMMKDACLKFYVKNLFDEEYQDASGYPATDRTYGVALSFGF
jgi:outer membrane receptor for ferrienterochelin and colicin